MITRIKTPLNVSTIPAYNTAPLSAAELQFNQILHGNDSAAMPLLNNTTELHSNYKNTSISFGVFDNDTILTETTTQGPSLFTNLSAPTKALVMGLPLIENEELIRSGNNELMNSKSDTSAQDNDSSTTATKSFVSESSTSTSVMTPQKKNTTNPVTSSGDTKRRKTDVNMEHLEIELLSLKRFSVIMTEGIKLTDEEAEFESSDIWFQLPSGNHVLRDSVILEIEHLLIKLRPTSLISQINVDHILRLQNVLMRSVTYGCESDWFSESFTEQQQQLTINMLNACCLMLQIFNLGVPEKRIYLDTYFNQVTSLVYKFCEDCLLKRESLGSVDFLNLVAKILQLFSFYLVGHSINDNLITKLEYLSLMIFFHPAEKTFNVVKMSSTLLITTIFQHKRDQREFIIDEILTNLEKLPTHKIQSRQIKVHSGIGLQLITTLILSLVETTNIRQGQYINDLYNGSVVYSPQELEQRLKEDIRFREFVTASTNERERVLKYLSSGLVSKVINQPTTFMKQLFELILQDLLNIVAFPEWSSTESLLFEITKTLIYISENQSSSVETFLLEMIGLVGSTMIQLRGKSEVVSVPTASLSEHYSNVYSFLNLQRGTFFHYNSADFFMSRWIESLLNESPSSEQVCGYLQGLLVGYFQGKSNSMIPRLDGDVSSLQESMNAHYSHILLQSDFIKLYQSFLNQLLKSVDHPKIKSRSRALKNLAQLIHKDDRLLSIPQVRQSLSNRIHDPSALVKSAVLEIFDQYILSKPELIPEFYQSIILTTDKSLLIRSKSLKIAKRIFNDTVNSDIKLFCLEKVLRRLDDDEESIVELSKTTLTDLLFVPVLDDQFTARASVECIVNLVSRSDRNWALFENYLFDDVLRLTEFNKHHFQRLEVSCSNIVRNIFSFVLDKIDSDSQQDAESNLGLLSIFSKADQHFINQGQLLTLQPYIESNNQSSSLITYYSLVILKNCLDQSFSLRESFLEAAQTSLFKRLTRFSIKELEYAMPCVWMLSEMRNDTSKLVNAAISCLEKVKPFVEKVLKNELKDSSPILQRLLYLIGNFGKSCDMEKHRSLFLKVKSLGIKEKESVLSLVTKNILVFTRLNVNRQIRRAAIKNMVSICSTHPKLFLNDAVLKVLDQEFKSDRYDFKDVIIEGLLEFLAREEKIAKKKTGKDTKLSKAVALDVDVFHGNSKTFENDGICASLVQRFLDPVLELCLYDDGEFSYVAVKYLKTVVKLGFANPRICIPTIIALQASHIPYIRSVGLELHKELHEKHESLIDTSYTQGFKLASEYCFRINPSMLFGNNMFLLRFYKVVEDSKVSRKRLLTHLIKSLKFDSQKLSSSEALSTYNYCLFVAANVAECDFTGNDEVLMLIEGLETILNSQGLQIQKFLSQQSSESSVPDPENLMKYAYLSCIIINFHKLIQNLRTEYKLPESVNKTEVVNQKVKPHDKITLSLRLVDPHEDPKTTIFTEILELAL
ncbi:hypothetical protein WICPIJ_004055 [Wickerhamomyces pijperi]|uniref:Sister chromatid cohesion protein n=1 Tax=Wickerhamomyces pijperi TaxID=599730 RepID=A0A9P8TN52_WICPI|nr:hypothetical protein WICPIJ_004055 [Wickerhamomyces pijperi]